MPIPRSPHVAAAWLFSALLVASPQMAASSRDKSFVMNFSEPMIAGEKVLAPGTYVWKLVDSASNRHIVQISNQKTGRVEATILAIPTYRANVTSKNELQFWETPKGIPRAVRAWFYAGDNDGQEFPYPKKLVALLATLLPTQAPPTTRPQRGATVAVVPGGGRKTTAKRSLAPEAAPHKPEIAASTEHATPSSVESVAAPEHIAAEPVVAKPTLSKPGESDAQPKGVWNDMRNLPLGASLAWVGGLIGLCSLVLFFFTLTKRKGGKASAR